MNLQPFSQNPDKYLLYLNKNGNIESHKKGLITWIRSNIFEKSSYDLKNILSKINEIGVDKLTDQEIYAINKSFYAHQTKGSNALPVWTEAARHLAKNKFPDGLNTVTPHHEKTPTASTDSIQNAVPTQKTEPIEIKLIRENLKTLTPINFTIFILTNYKNNPEETKSNLLHFLKTDLDMAEMIYDSLDVENILNESQKYLDVTEHLNAQTTIYTTFNTQLTEVDKFKDVYGQELNKTKTNN